MNSEARDRRRLSMPLPSLSSVFVVILLAVLGAAVWMDRNHWHWYATDPDLMRSLETRVDDLEMRQDRQGTQLRDAISEIDQQQRGGAETPTLQLVDHPEAAIARIANSVALLSLVSNHGGTQSTGSAQGQACVAWYLKGEGSASDCGWLRAD